MLVGFNEHVCSGPYCRKVTIIGCVYHVTCSLCSCCVSEIQIQRVVDVDVQLLPFLTNKSIVKLWEVWVNSQPGKNNRVSGHNLT
jgi:hypothetical protein